MNKADFTQRFQSFEEREDVKESMRVMTIVLAQMYEKHGITMMPHGKAHDYFMEELEVPQIDREELQRETEELRPAIARLQQEKE